MKATLAQKKRMLKRLYRLWEVSIVLELTCSLELKRAYFKLEDEIKENNSEKNKNKI